MSTTIVGMLIERDGMFHQRVLVQPELERVGPLAFRKPAPVMRSRFGRIDTLHLRSAQPDWIGLNVDHDIRSTIGTIVHLELRASGEAWAIAVADGPVPDGPLYFSPRVETRGDDTMLITDAALTTSPAQVCLPALTVLPGDLDHADISGLPEYQREMVTRARATVHRRAHRSPVYLHDQDQRRAEQREQREYAELHLRAGQAGAQLHIRGGGRVLRVS